jgi:Coenzyme PQQ synthesis protein D (PqqD)
VNVVDRPQRMDGFKLETLDDELLLYHPHQTRAIYMNQTASLVWALCDGRPIDEIIQLLTEAYPDASSTLATEVRDVISRLHEQGALRQA